MTELKIEPGGSASVYVLHEGYVGRDGDDERVAGTVTLILDGDAVIVVDPGMVASREALLAALTAYGPQPGDVTDVVFSHHHPDHTVNAALFPAARIKAAKLRVGRVCRWGTGGRRVEFVGTEAGAGEEPQPCPFAELGEHGPRGLTSSRTARSWPLQSRGGWLVMIAVIRSGGWAAEAGGVCCGGRGGSGRA